MNPLEIPEYQDRLRKQAESLGRDFDEDLRLLNRLREMSRLSGLQDLLEQQPDALTRLAEAPDLSPWKDCGNVVCEENEEQDTPDPLDQLAFLTPSPAETLIEEVRAIRRELREAKQKPFRKGRHNSARRRDS